MPSHVLVNGLGLTYKSTIGISIATIPDVCKTPSPGGPIPIPYPNIANQGTLGGGTTTVKAKGKMIAIKGSQYKSSNGDEPGTAGGVKSNVNMKATDWITYSFDVKMDGKNACRHTDKKFHNNQNTVDLAGNVDPGPPGANPLEISCEGQDFSDCQKEEICAKCAEINKRSTKSATGPQPGKAATGPLGGHQRIGGGRRFSDAERATYKQHRYEGNKKAGDLKKSARNGDPVIDFYPVSQDCKDKLKKEAEDCNWDEFSADHTNEIQLGGHPTSESNLKWLSKAPNEFMGRELKKFCCPEDAWGRTDGGPHTGVKPVDCGCKE